jgi:hypothetical protein
MHNYTIYVYTSGAYSKQTKSPPIAAIHPTKSETRPMRGKKANLPSGPSSRNVPTVVEGYIDMLS